MLMHTVTILLSLHSHDFLLAQPLMDNLEAQTYETFEKDIVKYTQVCHM
jgi:hypothetical protein